MEDIIFINNEKPNLLQQMFVVNKLKKLNNNYIHYGFRNANDGKWFYLYGTRARVICATPSSSWDGRGFSEIKIGHCDFKFDKLTKNLHIGLIKVEEAFRGNGIGREMLEYVKEVAIKLNAKSITLDSLCVYTNGEKTVTYYADELSKQDIASLNEESIKNGKIVFDRNLKFYLNHGFVKDLGRRPEQPHLIPMVLSRIKPADMKKVQIGKVYRLKLNKSEVQSHDDRCIIYGNMPLESLSDNQFDKRCNLNPKRLL